MKLDYTIKKAKELVEELDGMYDLKETGLAIVIHDELTEYHKNLDAFGYKIAQDRLSTKARLILGLGYAEFLVDPDGYDQDHEHGIAVEKRIGLLNLLKIDSDKLYVEMERTYGREVG